MAPGMIRLIPLLAVVRLLVALTGSAQGYEYIPARIDGPKLSGRSNLSPAWTLPLRH